MDRREWEIISNAQKAGWALIQVNPLVFRMPDGSIVEIGTIE